MKPSSIIIILLTLIIVLLGYDKFSNLNTSQNSSFYTNQNNTISGNVKFGSGDCFPSAGTPAGGVKRGRGLKNYNGKIYFVSESDILSASKNQEGKTQTELENIMFDNSIQTLVVNGYYSYSNIPLGKYYLMIPKEGTYTNEFVFEVKSLNQKIIQDAQFFQCTSY
ncbi:hypothetical protein IT403_03400 [Candidatus Nomurabacteria bacterium]|nr:hypothetical protein [Candidatus Nomurabacteria bacterium]